MSSVGCYAIDTNQYTRLGDESKYVTVVKHSFYAPTSVTPTKAYINALAKAASFQVAESPHDAADSFGHNAAYLIRYHPEWLLRDLDGNFARSSDFGQMYLPDPADVTARATWARFINEQMEYKGYTDGIWVDDVNLHPGHGLDGRLARRARNGSMVAYSDDAYGTDVAMWICFIADYCRNRKMPVWINLGANAWDSIQAANAVKIAAHVTGINREHWCRYRNADGSFGPLFSNQSGYEPSIQTMLDYARDIQAQGAHISGVDYGHSTADAADQAAMIFGRALFLLAWDGRAGSFYAYRPDGVTDPAQDPRWMIDIGVPTAPYVIQADATYSRTYSGGTVTLNPKYGFQAATITPS